MIRHVVREIMLPVLRRIMQNAMNRFHECVQRNGGHRKDEIFKK